MVVIGIFLVVSVVVALIWFFASWIIHIIMVINDCEEWGFANFYKFLEEFNKIKDNLDLKVKKKYVAIYKDGESVVYIWASIIKFKGRGMILYPWSWISFKLWEKKVLNNGGYKRRLWK